MLLDISYCKHTLYKKVLKSLSCLWKIFSYIVEWNSNYSEIEGVRLYILAMEGCHGTIE